MKMLEKSQEIVLILLNPLSHPFSKVFRLDDLQMAQNGTNEEEEDEENANSNGGAHFPAKFAYLFLFDSADTKKLSMGLDELMDSLVCQQLLVQLTEQELVMAANGPKENGV
jgi:hypothetical protein